MGIVGSLATRRHVSLGPSCTYSDHCPAGYSICLEPQLTFSVCSANFASIWRLVTIVEHQAATWPTFDPSWYGCVSIVLAAVEVDMAVVCASVPVFWPVLHSTGFEIFITKEVQVTSESRLGSIDHTEEAIELQFAGAMPAGAGAGTNMLDRQASLRSKAGSEENLHKASSRHSSDGSHHGHYNHKFGLSEVDPSSRTPWTQPSTRVKISTNSGTIKS